MGTITLEGLGDNSEFKCGVKCWTETGWKICNERAVIKISGDIGFAYRCVLHRTQHTLRKKVEK